jgi:hypothetical protein
MRFAVVVRIGVASILLGAATAQAQGLPTCRVLLVKSPATEAVSKTVIQEVKTWVEDRERGSKLASSIDEADVVLEFSRFGLGQFDGIPTWQWRFVAPGASRSRTASANGYRFHPRGRSRPWEHGAPREEAADHPHGCLHGLAPKVASAEKR